VQGQLLGLSLFKVFLSFADLSLDFACAGFDTSFASQPGAASGGSGGLFDLSFNFFDTTLGFVFCACAIALSPGLSAARCEVRRD